MTLEIKAVFFCNFPPSHPRAALKMYVSCPRSMGRLRTDNFSACLRLHTFYDRLLFSCWFFTRSTFVYEQIWKINLTDSIIIHILLAHIWFLALTLTICSTTNHNCTEKMCFFKFLSLRWQEFISLSKCLNSS